MKIKSLLLLVVVSFSFFTVRAQNQETPPVTLEKISDNLYQVLGGRGANGGLYIGEKEVLVIDSKMDKASVDEVFEAVKNITDKPITFLVNTHSDGDHVNGNVYFPKSVTIVAQENCRKEFLGPQRDGSASPWLEEEMRAFIPEITFSDKMQIDMGNQVVELYYFGVGHTTGDAVVYFPNEKTAFIGDQAFWGRPQLIHSYKGGNSFEHAKTIKNLLTLDAEKFCSGHSEMKTRKDVEQHLADFVAFQTKVKGYYDQGKSLEETQSEFAENEARLVESVFTELKAMD